MNVPVLNKKTVKAVLLRGAEAGCSYEELVQLAISYGATRQTAVTLARRLKRKPAVPTAHFVQGGKPS